jgi:hypothetical protein
MIKGIIKQIPKRPNSDDIFSIPTSTGVVNVTLLNHVLYPGVVTRDAVLINTSQLKMFFRNHVIL